MSTTKRRKTGRVTLAQVAKHIGVTSMTVSRALRTPDAVSADMLEKVQSAVDELGYTPNQMAGSLASASSNLIAVLTPAVYSTAWQRALSHLQLRLQQQGYTVIQTASTEQQGIEETVRQCMKLSPVALVSAGLVLPEACQALLDKNSIPSIGMLDIEQSQCNLTVGINNRQASRELTEYLIHQGYKRIGFIGCTNNEVQHQQRLKGWREAMMANYLVPEMLVSSSRSPSLAEAQLLFNQLRREWGNVEAVICNDSLLATGIVFECQRQMLSIPHHLAIAVFDEEQIGERVHPQLTSVTFDLEQIAEQAADLVLERLNNKETGSRRLNAGYQLQFRASTSQMVFS